MMLLPDDLNSLLSSRRIGPVGMLADATANPEPAPITWQEFTLTAGDSGEWFGYSNGDIAYPPFNPPFGNISNEPTDTAELEAFYTDDLGVAVAIFQGDIQAQVQGLGLNIGGYAGVASDISLFGGNTIIRFTPDGINFQQDGEYLVRFSQA